MTPYECKSSGSPVTVCINYPPPAPPTLFEQVGQWVGLLADVALFVLVVSVAVLAARTVARVRS
ncbi:hypothetical protein GCM10009613_61000 [Pseudonocardia kongjuensis]|uniref:Uncharacterized protein n=1 Tax=Pseudonocardia kongjuensis TaxID=102227 RepID=A0ABP4IXT9_9PSEU